MDNCYVDINGKITDSLIGPHSVIATNLKEKPKGYRFILGERSKITI